MQRITILREIKVTYSDGTVISTNMAAHLTDQQMLNYFSIGRPVNIGNVTDNMQTIVAAEIII